MHLVVRVLLPLGLSSVALWVALRHGLVPLLRTVPDGSSPYRIKGILAGWLVCHLLMFFGYLQVSGTVNACEFATRLPLAMLLTLLFSLLPNCVSKTRFFYLKYDIFPTIYVPLCFLAASLCTLPDETRSGVRDFILATPFTRVIVTSFVGGVLIYLIVDHSFAILCVWYAPTAINLKLKHYMLLRPLGSHFLNVLLTASLIAGLIALSGGIVVSLAIATVLLLAVASAHVGKLRYLDMPVNIKHDVHFLREVVPLAPSYLGWGSVLGLSLAVALMLFSLRVIWPYWQAGLPEQPRFIMVGASVLLLGVFYSSAVRPAVKVIVSNLGIRATTFSAIPVWTLHERGVLLHSLLTPNEASVRKPDGYSRGKVETILNHYDLTRAESEPGKEALPELVIVYVMESFCDPTELGYTYSADPIPCFRRIASGFSTGHVVMPVFGGQSATSEFEILTAFSMAFLAPGICPYIGQIDRDLPSVASWLHSQGYRTTAVTADPSYYFGRPAVYKHIGIQDSVFLFGREGIPLDYSGRWPSDEAVVAEAHRAADVPGAAFVLALTTSTHGPYNYTIPEEIQVIGDLDKNTRRELTVYINALAVADRALERLISHFEHTTKRTLIVALGDHRPHFEHVLDPTAVSKGIEKFSVPVVIWQNYAAEKQHVLCSANFLLAQALPKVGVKEGRWLGLNQEFYKAMRVLSPHGVITWDDKLDMYPSHFIAMNGAALDYGTIQYDLMFGTGFSRPKMLAPLPRASYAGSTL